ncbi:MAG: cytochrome c [Chloroflexales bacterium]
MNAGGGNAPLPAREGQRLALAQETLRTDAVGDAAVTYVEYCTTCHGAAGSGGIGPAINSQQFLSRKNDAAITQTIIAGGTRPGSAMPAFGDRLTSVEINAIVTYIRSLQATAPNVANPRGTQQGGGGPPWMRATATPDPNGATAP